MTEWEIQQGDCSAVLASMAEHSVDACVTDPPYGLGFMGKEWDTFKPGVHQERKLPAWHGGDCRSPDSSCRAVVFVRGE